MGGRRRRKMLWGGWPLARSLALNSARTCWNNKSSRRRFSPRKRRGTFERHSDVGEARIDTHRKRGEDEEGGREGSGGATAKKKKKSCENSAAAVDFFAQSSAAATRAAASSSSSSTTTTSSSSATSCCCCRRRRCSSAETQRIFVEPPRTIPSRSDDRSSTIDPPQVSRATEPNTSR